MNWLFAALVALLIAAACQLDDIDAPYASDLQDAQQAARVAMKEMK